MSTFSTAVRNLPAHSHAEQWGVILSGLDTMGSCAEPARWKAAR